METRQVVRAGVSVALLAVSAWVSIPFGPVPFTLQTMVLAMLPAAMDRTTAVMSVVGYVLLGAVGLPVFSSFSGGVGVLAGPTGGFLWGFIFGMLLATTVAHSLPSSVSPYIRALISDVALLLVSYVCGTAQLMVVGSMGVLPALTVAVIPFIVPDAIKLAVGARVGCAVSRVHRIAA